MADTALFPDPRILDLMRSMNQGMPPWEAFRWFDTPVETQVVVPLTGVAVRLCGLSVRRVALLLALEGTAVVHVSTGSAGGTTGFTLGPNQSPLILRQAELGNLAQVDWWASSSAGSTVTVIEVLLRAWPGGDPVA